MDFLTIASAQNPKLKKAAELQQKSKARVKNKVILLEGFHLLGEYLTFENPEIENIFICETQLKNPEAKIIHSHSKKVAVLKHGLIQKVSSTKTSTGIVTVAKKPKQEVPEIILKASNSLVFMENIQDPGNLGTIIRSCAASGVNAIFIDQKTTDAWSPKVLRAGMGSHFKIPIYTTQNLSESIKTFPGTTYGAFMEGESCFKTKLDKKSAFVFGNEGQGLSPDIEKAIDKKISIPMVNSVESLNVATATSLCTYEYFRQHLG